MRESGVWRCGVSTSVVSNSLMGITGSVLQQGKFVEDGAVIARPNLRSVTYIGFSELSVRRARTPVLLWHVTFRQPHFFQRLTQITTVVQRSFGKLPPLARHPIIDA